MGESPEQEAYVKLSGPCKNVLEAEAFGFEAEAPAAAETRTHKELGAGDGGVEVQAASDSDSEHRLVATVRLSREHGRIGGGGRGEAMGYAVCDVRRAGAELKDRLLLRRRRLGAGLGGANRTTRWPEDCSLANIDFAEYSILGPLILGALAFISNLFQQSEPISVLALLIFLPNAIALSSLAFRLVGHQLRMNESTALLKAASSKDFLERLDTDTIAAASEIAMHAFVELCKQFTRVTFDLPEVTTAFGWLITNRYTRIMTPEFAYPQFGPAEHALCVWLNLHDLPFALQFEMDEIHCLLSHVNAMYSIESATRKLAHWYRQECFTPEQIEEDVAFLCFRPIIAMTSTDLKHPSGRGGFQKFHNCNYIGFSWRLTIDSDPSLNYQLPEWSRRTSVVFVANGASVKKIANIVHIASYVYHLPSEGIPPLALLGSDCVEISAKVIENEVMEGGRSNFPAALMHLFYYQQGLFAEEETSSTWNLLGQVVSPTTPPRQPVESPGVEEIQLPRGESAEAGAAAEEPEDRESRLRSLRTRRAELESKLQAGALRAENEVLEDRVMRAQEDFLGLQAEFKAMKEQHNERLDSLRLALEEQQKDAEQADRRVVCAEDLVRFHQEQRRMMASHWKQQCQMKDERIRYLNLQLTEYMIDWQQLGVQRQTEASLSHEHYCLEDRHRHLLQTQRNLTAETSRLESCLQQANTEEARLTEALRLAEARSPK
ncbi:unnamed protein product [Symbiodinium sp. KB8]|nr:unnamed protein product [Symbiodinium sp. KB8]